jgi:transcriptional regulator with XRE-family HTH domain
VSFVKLFFLFCLNQLHEGHIYDKLKKRRKQMTSNDMAKRIKDLRLEKGLTLEQVGKIVGVGKSTVRKWETGMIANMKRDKIASLSKALGVPPSYLLGYTDERTLQPTKEENELINLILQLTDEETEELSKFVDYIISKRK